jgi:ABC-type transport system involved in multi-copper enzyme maturation permease subunit
MSVFDRSYRRYKGVLKGRLYKIWHIAWNTFRVQFSGKKAIILGILCNLPVLVFTMMILFSVIFGGGLAELLLEAFGSVEFALYIIISLTFNSGIIFLPTVFSAAFNSGTIANDKKNNSLVLYMAKPLDRIDYIAGKSISVLIVNSFITVLPFYVFMLVFSFIQGFEGAAFFQSLWVYFAVLLISFVIALFFGSIVLMFSSITENSILSGIMSVLIIFLPATILSSIALVIEGDWIDYLSIPNLISAMCYTLLGSPSASESDAFFNLLQPGINGWASMGILLGVSILALGITTYIISKEEIEG